MIKGVSDKPYRLSQKVLIDKIFRLEKEKEALKSVLAFCREKLEIYRDHSTGEYQGGVEHTSLIRMIDETTDH